MASLQDIHAIGTLAERPTPGMTGRYYFAEDEGIMYRDSGLAWVEMVSAGGGLPIDDTITPQDGMTLLYNATSGLWYPGWYVTPPQRLVLDAGVGVTKDGSNLVSIWEDSSPGGNDAAQVTAGNRPLWVDAAINGQPTLRFDGTDDYITAPLPSAGWTAWTIAAVVKISASQSSVGVFSWANTNTSGGPLVLMQRFGADNRWIIADSYQWQYPHAVGTTKLYVARWSGTQHKLYINGVLQASQPTAGAGTYLQTTQTMYIGSGFNGYLNGDIPAFEVYAKALSDAEIIALNSRLMTKYGLS